MFRLVEQGILPCVQSRQECLSYCFWLFRGKLFIFYSCNYSDVRNNNALNPIFTKIAVRARKALDRSAARNYKCSL